jgi:hypothetical protein
VGARALGRYRGRNSCLESVIEADTNVRTQPVDGSRVGCCRAGWVLPIIDRIPTHKQRIHPIMEGRRMALASRGLALVGAITLALSGVGMSAAAPATTSIPLRGTKMASLSHGVAQFTQTAPGDFEVTVTVEKLPNPATLKTTPIRHAYVAWAFAASSATQQSGGQKKPAGARPQLGALTPIRLHATSSGIYTGSGAVMMKRAPAILVTAEVTETVQKPATPLWGVLIGRPGSM